MRFLSICVACACAALLSGCTYFTALAGGAGAGAPLLAELLNRREQLGRVQDFDITLFDGRAARVSDYSGQPLVLNFWADWCPPCIGELPHFNEVYKERRGQFVLLAVAVQSAKDPVGFVKEHGYELEFAKDTGGGAQLYGVKGIPTTLFISRSGRIVSKVVGGMDKAEFEANLAKIL